MNSGRADVPLNPSESIESSPLASSSVPPVLTYAPRVRWSRTLRRIVYLGCILATMALAALMHEQISGFIHRIEFALLMHRCMTFKAPSDWVAYEENVTRARALLTGKDYIPLRRSAAFASSPIAGYSPSCWRNLAPRTRSAPPWDAALLFLHERKTPSGKRRLLVIELDLIPNAKGDTVQFMIDVLDPSNEYKVRRGTYGMGISGVKLDRDGTALTNLRVYFGQQDQKDESHLTIPYELNGERCVAELWLGEAWDAQKVKEFGYDFCDVRFRISDFER